MSISDSLIVAATLMGPVLAVQVQKWVERWKESRSRKLSLFYTLMATRATRTSPDHVHALNMIDIEFQDSSWTAGRAQRDKDRVVREAWEEYRSHLNRFPVEDAPADAHNDNDATRAAQLTHWFTRSDALFVDLLHALSRNLGFGFSRTQVETSYVPQARAREAQRAELLHGAVMSILSGDTALRVELPSTPEDTAEWRALRADLRRFLHQHVRAESASDHTADQPKSVPLANELPSPTGKAS